MLSDFTPATQSHLSSLRKRSPVKPQLWQSGKYFTGPLGRQWQNKKLQGLAHDQAQRKPQESDRQHHKSLFDSKNRLFQEFMNIAKSKTKSLVPEKILRPSHPIPKRYKDYSTLLDILSLPHTLLSFIVGSFGLKYYETDSSIRMLQKVPNALYQHHAESSNVTCVNSLAVFSPNNSSISNSSWSGEKL